MLNADLPQYQKLGQVPKGLYILALPCKDFFLKHPREDLLLGEMIPSDTLQAFLSPPGRNAA